MIYITGDTHGEQARFSPVAMPGEDKWGEDDILIICGDFGFLFVNILYKIFFAALQFR